MTLWIKECAPKCVFSSRRENKMVINNLKILVSEPPRVFPGDSVT